MGSFTSYGRPGPAEKIEIPAGKVLYEFLVTFGLNSRPVIAGEGVGNAMMEIDSNAGGYAGGEIEVLIKQLFAKEASTTWTASGSDPRIQTDVGVIAFNDQSGFSNKVLFHQEDQFGESVSCDPGEWDLGHTSINGNITAINTPHGDIAPRLIIDNQPKDMPGSRDICIQKFRLYCLILIDTDKIVSLPSTGTLKKIG